MYVFKLLQIMHGVHARLSNFEPTTFIFYSGLALGLNIMAPGDALLPLGMIVHPFIHP
jgi:hypothetical protein